MDQVIQIQQQIQRLQQEVNDISQVCSQLQQSEQANALQLQQMTQKELLASQGLRRIQQAAGQLSQEINRISSITQQIVSQAAPFQRTFPGTGNLTGAYGTGLVGQTGTLYPQTGVSTYFNQPGTGTFGGAQYGSFGQLTTPQLGFQQGQNPTNLAGQLPNINMSTFTSQLHPYSQGYIPNQFGTGSQLGYSSQAFSIPMAGQMGSSQQGFNQGLSGVGGAQSQSNLQGASASLLGGMTSPMAQGSNIGLAGTQGANPGASFSQAGMGISGYSPYQANQFGFR